MNKKIFLAFVAGIMLGISSLTNASTFVKTFSDVPRGAYYEEALTEFTTREVIHGYENGLFGPGLFGPNDPVTRGQLVAILGRYDNSHVYSDGDVGKLIDLVCVLNTIDENHAHYSKYKELCDHPIN